MPLEPGRAYFMSAEVVFEPVYRVDLLQNQRVAGWNFRVLGTSVSSAGLDWFSRQQAEVRYTVRINSDAKQAVERYETDLKVFLDNMGSAGGLVGAGVICLSILHHLTCTHRRLKRLKRRQERLKRAEEAARIVLRVQRVLGKIAAPPPPAASPGPAPSTAWGSFSESKVVSSPALLPSRLPPPHNPRRAPAPHPSIRVETHPVPPPIYSESPAAPPCAGHCRLPKPNPPCVGLAPRPEPAPSSTLPRRRPPRLRNKKQRPRTPRPPACRSGAPGRRQRPHAARPAPPPAPPAPAPSPVPAAPGRRSPLPAATPPRMRRRPARAPRPGGCSSSPSPAATTTGRRRAGCERRPPPPCLPRASCAGCEGGTWGKSEGVEGRPRRAPAGPLQRVEPTTEPAVPSA